MLKKLILFVSNLIDRPFAEGRIIANRYKVIKHIGTGSYGRSYLVFDQCYKQNVVLKALRLHKRITNSGRQGFESEIEILKKINHNRIPLFLQSGCDGNIPFYTMEYIDGKNFEQLIFREEKHYSETEAFMIAHKLLLLIDFLHSRNIIHRDIRIPNVIMNGSDIWLIDLGLAAEDVNDDSGNLDDPRKQINEQADFYALGHFLLFLLYSNFSFSKGLKEKSWEEELTISHYAKQIIRRLLQIEKPYDNCHQIETDIQMLLLIGGSVNVSS